MTQKSNELQIPASSAQFDLAAAFLVCISLAAAILYPEIFISKPPFFGSLNYSPLTLLFPFVAVGVLVYAYILRNELIPGLLDISVFLYGGYLLVRNINGTSSLVLGKYIVFGLGLYYLTTLLASRRENLLRVLTYTLLVLMTATALYGLLEYAVQDNFIYRDFIVDVVRDPTVGLHRIGSTIAHPVPYGAFLLQSLPFAILIWIMATDKWERAAGMAATLLAVLALFFTFSKGSWIVALILAGAALLFYRGGRSRSIILPALVILAVVAFTTVLSWQQVRFETETRAEGSVDVRLVGWKAAIDGIAEHPAVGVGLRQGEQEIKKHIDPDWYELADRPLPVDNYYLSLVLEAGFVGLAIWVAMFSLMLMEGIKVVRNRNPGWQWALASLASIVGISLNAFTFEAMHIWSNYIVFWIAAGIIHGISWRQVSTRSAYELAIK